jgi:hypothetical protein
MSPKSIHLISKVKVLLVSIYLTNNTNKEIGLLVKTLGGSQKLIESFVTL